MRVEARTGAISDDVAAASTGPRRTPPRARAGLRLPPSVSPRLLLKGYPVGRDFQLATSDLQHPLHGSIGTSAVQSLAMTPADCSRQQDRRSDSAVGRGITPHTGDFANDLRTAVPERLERSQQMLEIPVEPWSPYAEAWLS